MLGPDRSFSTQDADVRFRTIVEHAAIGIALVDLQGRPVEVNPALSQMLGYSADEMGEMTFAEFTHPEDMAADLALFGELVEGDRSFYQIEKRYLHKMGHVVWTQLTVSLLRDAEGQPTHALGMVEDISQRKRAEEALERERAYFERLFEQMPKAVVLLDPEDRVLRVNPEFTRLFGYTAHEVVGQVLTPRITPEHLQDEALSLNAQATEARFQRETVRRHKDGHVIPVSVTGTAVELDGERVAVYGMYRDISEQKELERRLHQMAATDPLTGLFNRRGFLNQVQRHWERLHAHEHTVLLLYVDVDDFKPINDRHGHAEGDRVLQDLAELLRRCFRASDVLARFGGDEFVVLATDADPDAERVIRSRLKGALERFNADGSRGYDVSLSVGAVRLDASQAQSVEDLLFEADRRMYEQKRRRGSTGAN